MNRTGSKILHGLLLATSGLVGSTIIASTAAMAGGGPSGGKVAVGAATIVNASPTQTVINQSSKKALINWNSFSIAAGSSVKFNQPNSKSLAVNRVTGPSASTIDGQLLANGNVWLINANGVLFGKGSQVNVGSLLATTSDLSDDDFKKGNYNFDPAANPNAGVVNKGTITAGRGGSVVLSAPTVSNEGLIHADLGTVVLGGAKAFTVDMTGDNLLRYEITAPVDSTPRDANGNAASALVSNSGTIMAAGGHVMMTARAARNIENNVINNTGMVEATTVSSHNGEIDLDAGPDGTVNDSGTLDASGAAQGQTGGTVNVTGGTVNVADGAKIDASGNAGGGTVQIGGGLHGRGTLAHAQRTIIGGATIAADATGKGNGGTVAVWSDGGTSFAGSISAKGGAQGGNGGQVETSGHTLGVAASAKVDTSAPLGLTGDWLLDPDTLYITSGTGGTQLPGNGTLNDGNSSETIGATTITNQLLSTNVTLEANQQINVCATIAYTSPNALSLLSGGDISVNADVQNSGTGAINLVAGWDGHTTDFSGVIPNSAYGNGGAGNVSVSATGSAVSVGSAGGKTLIAGYDVGVQSNGANAQIGYRGAGGGEIDVLAVNALSVTSGASHTITRIGNGGTGIAGAVGGNINVNTGSLTLEAENSDTTVIIGNAGTNGITGNINISASGALALNETVTNSAAIVGNGDFDLSTMGNVGGDITVDAGSIAITGNTSAQAAIGNRGLTGVSGNLDVETTSSDLQITANDVGLASIGNRVGAIDGDNLVTGSSSGSIKVASAGMLAITANDSGQARIASGFAANTSINVTAAGAISLLVSGQPAQGGAAGQAFIGNFGNYQSAAGGNITVTSTGNGISLSAEEEGAFVGIGNSGGLASTSGNIKVSASAPSTGSISLDADANNALVWIGNSSSSGTVSGDIAVTSGDYFQILSQADGSIAQIGNGGTFDQGYTGGNINGTIAINAGNGFQLDAGTMQDAVALLGNGDALQGRAGNVSGDIALNVVGDTKIDTNVCATAWIGNVAGFGNVETGNLTIITTSSGDLSGQEFLTSDLGSGGSDGGNVFVGFTDPTNGVTFSLGESYTSSHTFTLAGASDLTIDNNIINDGSGDVNLIAGWDGHTTDLTALTNSNVTSATTYGANSGGVTIENASVGSAGGKTTVAGYTITLDGTYGPSQIGYYGDGGGDITVLSKTDVTLRGSSFDGGGFAQIGNGGDHDQEGTGNTGNISIIAGGNLMLTGGEGSYYAQVGNGGAELNGTVSGDISVNVNGDITLEGYSGSGADHGYALIGNGGYDFSGDISGNIVVRAGGDISLSAGDDVGYAQIGNSNPTDECDCDPSGDISVTATGAVTLSGGDGDLAYAQIGNGGAESGSALNSGNITLVAGDDLTLNGGDGELAYAQIGNGGDGASGVNSGDIAVNVTGSISLYGSADYAQIGNGGYYAGDSSGAINVSATGNIVLSGASDSNYGYAQIGSGGEEAQGLNSGDIVVSALGTISLTGDDGYAQIGNGGHGATGANSGNIVVNANGAISLTSDSDYAQIGNGGEDANGGIGDIVVSSGGSILLDGENGYAQIGDGGYPTADVGVGSGNITITTAGDLTLTGGEGSSQIGNGGGMFVGDVSGNIAIHVNGTTSIDYDGWIGNWTDGGTASGDVSIITGSGDIDGEFLDADLQNGNVLLGWTGGDVQWANKFDYNSSHTLSVLGTGNFDLKASISNNGSGAINLVAGWDGHTTNLASLKNSGVFGKNSGSVTIDGSSNNVSVGSAGGTTTVLGYDIDVSGGQGNAQIGYNGVGTGNIVVQGTHDLLLTAGAGGVPCCGCGNGSNVGYAQIGNGGAFVSGPDSGNITVTVGRNVSLTGGSNTYGYASIGNGGDTGSQGDSGNIAITAGGSVSLTGGVDYAQIGNGQWGSTGSSGNITVTAAQNITLTGANGSSWGYAQIGNGGQNASGNISGNIRVSAGGALTLKAGNSGMYAQIGNGADKATSGGSKTSGNISISAGSLSLTGSTSGAGTDSYAQIGNTAVFNSGVVGSGAASGGININVTGATTFTSTLGQGDVWIGNVGAKGGTETGAVSLLTGTFNADGENNGDLRNFLIADLSGGNVTIGVKNTGASINIDEELDYTSANNLTLLTAGNLTISGGIQNAGNGNILLVTGWNPNVAPANVTTTTGSYGNGNTGFFLGGNGATSDSMVGSAHGKTTVLTRNLNITAVHGTAGLGFEGASNGSIVVSARGNIAVVGQSSDRFALIGNLGIGNQAVSGNITIADTGSFTLTNAILGNFDLGDAAVSGNVNLTASSMAASGASVLSGSSAVITLTGAGAAIGSASNPLLTDVNTIAVVTNNGSAYISAPDNGLSVGVGNSGINLGSGNLVLSAGGAIGQTAAIKAASVTASAKSGAITLSNTANSYGAISLSTTGSFSASIVDTSDLTVGSVNVGGSVTLRTKGDLTFTKSIQLQNGSLLALAGWDGTATGATANGYGNNGGDIFIGGGSAAGDVAIGSASGTTTLAGANVTLSAVNGYAQIGYHGAGSGAINLLATGNVALNGGGSTGYFAQIGDGGYKVSGSSSAPISVVAGGDIALNAGAGQEAYAQIGNGGAESNSNSSGYSETGLVTVSGETVTLAAGSGTGSYAQIGHGGYKSGQAIDGIATLGGNITVDAVDAIRLVGGGIDAYAQIGQGGNFLNNGAANGASGTISGDIDVAVATPNTPTGADPLTLTAGTGANSFAQIGNGGQGENIPAAGATANFTISGNVTVADLTLTGSNTGANGYAQIGNGDASKTGFGNVSGQVTLGQGTDITYVPGKAPGSSTGLGNATGTGTVTGTLPSGNVDAGTQGSVASITQNSTGPTNFNISMITVTPEVTPFNFSDKGTASQSPTPFDQLADNSNSEGQIASDSVSQSVGQSLGDGKTIYVTSKTLIPGMLKQIVTLTRNNPNGIPPADEDYSSWGNEALWRW